MNIYYLDEVDEPVFFPYQPDVKTRHDMEPCNFGEYIPSPKNGGNLIHRSRLIAVTHDPVLPVLLMALLGCFLGWIIQSYCKTHLNLIVWTSITFGSLALVHYFYTLYRVVRFNRTP